MYGGAEVVLPVGRTDCLYRVPTQHWLADGQADVRLISEMRGPVVGWLYCRDWPVSAEL